MNILDIFYNNIVSEAMNGRIDCFIYYNIAFSTKIYNYKEYECQIENDGVLIPTLMIKDKIKFDSLLTQYVHEAMDFYDDKNFPPEILNYMSYDGDKKICKEKAILAMLFANATLEDFNNPCEFLRRRINFFRNDISVKHDLGYSETLRGNVTIDITKDVINNETPYQMIIKVGNDNGDEYIFPRVKIGICDGKAYIYAIQNHNNDNNDHNNAFYKKINRVLYKVGEGFELDESNEEEKLKDVTSSFLVSLNICVAYLYSKGYTDIVVPSFLIERWNAKSIANSMKIQYKKLDSVESSKLSVEQDYIQSNLTNKLVRTFLRLACHYNNIQVDSLPFEVDSCLNINITSEPVKCNNTLLYETHNLVNNSNTNYRKK